MRGRGGVQADVGVRRIAETTAERAVGDEGRERAVPVVAGRGEDAVHAVADRTAKGGGRGRDRRDCDGGGLEVFDLALRVGERVAAERREIDVDLRERREEPWPCDERQPVDAVAECGELRTRPHIADEQEARARMVAQHRRQRRLGEREIEIVHDRAAQVRETHDLVVAGAAGGGMARALGGRELRRAEDVPHDDARDAGAFGRGDERLGRAEKRIAGDERLPIALDVRAPAGALVLGQERKRVLRYRGGLEHEIVAREDERSPERARGREPARHPVAHRDAIDDDQVGGGDRGRQRRVGEIVCVARDTAEAQLLAKVPDAVAVRRAVDPRDEEHVAELRSRRHVARTRRRGCGRGARERRCGRTRRARRRRGSMHLAVHALQLIEL